ncbi:MAG TPA: peptidase S8, partial [Ignavibacteriales bacterium]|nr:peptidase S8 [Ignavibacteriales bacterium]
KFISAGTHSIEFDGTNLPNGIYFYRIKIGNYIETRKLILQK